MTCAYCEKRLTCDACQADVVPTTPEQHRDFSRSEVPILCPGCGEPLVCKWCKMPYDGRTGEDSTDG